MASLRRFLKSLAGRKGKASRGGTPGSHVNTKRNKRIANKALRGSDFDIEGVQTGRASHRVNCIKEIDRERK